MTLTIYDFLNVMLLPVVVYYVQLYPVRLGQGLHQLILKTMMLLKQLDPLMLTRLKFSLIPVYERR